MLNKFKKLSIFSFRKVSLTFKITLWYTTFIVLLIGSLIIGTFFVSDNVAESSGKKKLIEELLEKRKFLYQISADYIIDINEYTNIYETVDRIKEAYIIS